MSKHNILKIFTDGASRGNPGPAGAGIKIITPSPPSTHSISVYLGTKTNNEAEYLALLISLKHIIKLCDNDPKMTALKTTGMVFYMDSKLVVEQMNNNWSIKNPRMKKLHDQCFLEINNHSLITSFVHIDREQNSEADWLANQAIDLQKNTN